MKQPSPRHFLKFIFFIIFAFLISACGEKTEESTGDKPQTKVASDTLGFNKNQQGQIKIAVLGTSDFFPDRAVQQRMGLPEDLAARVIEHLQKSNRFNVLERTALRKIINEQQFGQGDKESFLDRTLNAATENLPDVSGYAVKWTGLLSDHNDIVKEYQNLGTTIGADFLVFAVLEKADEKIKSTAIPYSQTGKTITKHVSDARLRLRVINTETGMIAGTSSFRTQVSESVFEGQESKRDEYSTFDHVGALAAQKILDIVSPAKIVSADPFVINRGTNDGYMVDSTFKISREGKEIQDPSGVAIGRVKTPMGNIKLASVQDTLSVIEIVDGDVQIGDLLEIKDQQANTAQQADKPIERTSKDGKLTIAVGKVHFNPNNNNTIFLSIDDYPRVKNDLMIKLTNTNRFDVLERHEIDQVLDEKNFTALMGGDEIEPHLKELIGADYLVLTAVDKFSVTSESKQVAYVDKIQTRHYGIVEATLRIVDSHTGKLLAADKIRINKKLNKYNKNESANTYSNLIEDFTNLMVSKIVHRIYPIKIMATLPDGSIYINRGLDGGLKSGDIFNVMHPGQELIDPDTGISFGSTEAKVAELKIDIVETSRSKASVTSGGEVQRGDILRELQKPAAQQPQVNVNKPNF
jgi:curli biogenesis system outer membrane secretion channel CsgG